MMDIEKPIEQLNKIRGYWIHDKIQSNQSTT